MLWSRDNGWAEMLRFFELERDVEKRRKGGKEKRRGEKKRKGEKEKSKKQKRRKGEEEKREAKRGRISAVYSV